MICNKKFIILFSIFYFLSSLAPALAFEASSTSFEMHGAAVESVSGSSSSASFGEQSGGGQNATGIIANVKKVFSGVLYWLFGWYTPRYDQVHYRWRNDDGSEAAATWAQAEDASYPGLQKSTTKRLRFEISNDGWTRGSAPQFKLQYKQSADCTGESYTDVPVTPTAEHWQMATSTYFADGDGTTNVSGGLTDANASSTTGQMKESGNTTSAITLNSDNFTEIEFSIQATTNANQGAAYCLRVLDTNLAPTKMAYTKYAQATISGYPANGSVVSSTYDTGLADGAAYNSIIWQGALNGGKVKFQFGASSTTTDSSFAYYGPACTVAGTDLYDIAPDTPVEIGCSTVHNNKRYFRYQIFLCSASDCASAGSNTPQVDNVSVNWSP